MREYGKECIERGLRESELERVRDEIIERERIYREVREEREKNCGMGRWKKVVEMGRRLEKEERKKLKIRFLYYYFNWVKFY